MNINDGMACITGILSSIVSLVVLSNFIYYTKSQIDKKLKDIDSGITTTKEGVIKEFNDKIANIELKMDNMLKALYESKQEEKNISIDMLKITDTMREEVRNDYIRRYNDLVATLNTKADESDFARLETKFDKVSETLTALKTIIEVRVMHKDSKDIN
jgi:hypothetical protein